MRLAVEVSHHCGLAEVALAVALDRLLASAGRELAGDRPVDLDVARLRVVGGVVGVGPGQAGIADTGRGEHAVAIGEVDDEPGLAAEVADREGQPQDDVDALVGHEVAERDDRCACREPRVDAG